MFLRTRNVPTRVAAGAYVLHTGLENWKGSEEQAKALHGMASGSYPFVEKIEPATFLKILAAAEIGVGAALLTPFVSNRLAGSVLTAFAGSLVTLYLRTPALHKPGSVWPTQQGVGVSKDVWMLGIGLGLVADGPGRSNAAKPARSEA